MFIHCSGKVNSRIDLLLHSPSLCFLSCSATSISDSIVEYRIFSNLTIESVTLFTANSRESCKEALLFFPACSRLSSIQERCQANLPVLTHCSFALSMKDSCRVTEGNALWWTMKCPQYLCIVLWRCIFCKVEIAGEELWQEIHCEEGSTNIQLLYLDLHWTQFIGFSSTSESPLSQGYYLFCCQLLSPIFWCFIAQKYCIIRLRKECWSICCSCRKKFEEAIPREVLFCLFFHSVVAETCPPLMSLTNLIFSIFYLS